MKIKKTSSNKYLIFLSICIFAANYNFTAAQDFWYKLNSPTENFLRSVHFLDSLTGWVAGDSGLILFTNNGGLDWTEQETGTDAKMQDVFFLNEQLGWAVAWREAVPPIGTIILTTTNGGSDWSSRDYSEENVFLSTVYFQDSLNGWMGGYPGDMVRTTDGGMNWKQANIDTGTFAFFPALNFDFYSSTYGFASGGVHDIAGVIWKTTNGGDNWTALDPIYAPPDEIWDLHFFDSLNILGVGGDPDLFGVGIIRSSDAGETWAYSEIGLIGVARAVSFRTELEGWAPVPNVQSLIYTTDGGDNWIDIATPSNSSIYDLVMTDTLTGYAVGFGGVIIKYKYPLVNNTDEIISAETFKLFQNYPNPFNPVSTIKFSLQEISKVELTVYNISGEEIAVLIDKELAKGGHEANFDASHLPSGIYFYKLTAQSIDDPSKQFTSVKKMVLIK